MSTGSVQQRTVDTLRKQLQQTRTEMRQMRLRVAARDKQIGEMSRKISEQDRMLVELNRRVMDHDQLFDDMSAKVTRTRSAEDLCVKQQRIDAPSTSTGETSPLKPSLRLAGPEASMSSPATQCSDVTTKESRKRKRSSDDYNLQAEQSQKAGSPSVHRLRSGRLYRK